MRSSIYAVVLSGNIQGHGQWLVVRAVTAMCGGPSAKAFTFKRNRESGK